MVEIRSRMSILNYFKSVSQALNQQESSATPPESAQEHNLPQISLLNQPGTSISTHTQSDNSNNTVEEHVCGPPSPKQPCLVPSPGCHDLAKFAGSTVDPSDEEKYELTPSNQELITRFPRVQLVAL